jgi:hypothetical protein
MTVQIRRMLLAAPLAVAALALAPTSARAQDLVDESTGVKFQPQITVEGTNYKCLGAGVRKVLFFKAYATTFCVENEVPAAATAIAQANKANADKLAENANFYSTLIEQSGGKLVLMKLVRDISAERMAKAFREGLSKVLPPAKIDKLIAVIPGDAKEGQTVALFSQGNKLTIDMGGGKKTIEDAEIAQKLWYVWLGPEGVSPTLKASIAKNLAK